MASSDFLENMMVTTEQLHDLELSMLLEQIEMMDRILVEHASGVNSSLSAARIVLQLQEMIQNKSTRLVYVQSHREVHVVLYYCRKFLKNIDISMSIDPSPGKSKLSKVNRLICFHNMFRLVADKDSFALTVKYYGGVSNFLRLYPPSSQDPTQPPFFILDNEHKKEFGMACLITDYFMYTKVDTFPTVNENRMLSDCVIFPEDGPLRFFEDIDKVRDLVNRDRFAKNSLDIHEAFWIKYPGRIEYTETMGFCWVINKLSQLPLDGTCNDEIGIVMETGNFLSKFSSKHKLQGTKFHLTLQDDNGNVVARNGVLLGLLYYAAYSCDKHSTIHIIDDSAVNNSPAVSIKFSPLLEKQDCIMQWDYFARESSDFVCIDCLITQYFYLGFNFDRFIDVSHELIDNIDILGNQQHIIKDGAHLVKIFWTLLNVDRRALIFKEKFDKFGFGGIFDILAGRFAWLPEKMTEEEMKDWNETTIYGYVKDIKFGAREIRRHPVELIRIDIISAKLLIQDTYSGGFKRVFSLMTLVNLYRALRFLFLENDFRS
jgi:hypothetical protein